MLARANLGVEKLRFMFRLAMDLRCLDLRRYEHVARRAASSSVVSVFLPLRFAT